MIYMNNAATSYPKAPGVGQAVVGHLDAIPEAAGRAIDREESDGVFGGEPGGAFCGETVGACGEVPGGDGLGSDRKPMKELTCREQLAKLLGLQNADRIIYAANATAALNIGLLGFPWHCNNERRDVVLTTNAEHNSVLRPLYLLKKHGILDYYLLPVEADGRIDPDAWQEALWRYRPRMAVFTHGSNVTGAVNPVRELAAMAAEAGCVVFLDASQTMGIVPVRPEEWQIDMMAFTGHKYLLGPQGTGGLYVSERISLEPVFSGGTGIHSDEDEMPAALPLRLEAGTHNGPSFAGLSEALRWQEQNPPDLERMISYIDEIQQKLIRWGYRVVDVRGERTPILAFSSPVFDPESIGEILYGSYDIICRTGLHCAPKILTSIGAGDGGGTVRISLSRFTTREEVDILLEALAEIGRAHETLGL